MDDAEVEDVDVGGVFGGFEDGLVGGWVGKRGVRASVIQRLVRKWKLLPTTGLHLFFVSPHLTAQGLPEVKAHPLGGVSVLGDGFPQTA